MAEDKSGKPPPLMGATAIRPPDRVGMEKYTYMLWDGKTGEILTRTPKSWALIFVFYCIYYSCLAAFWLAAMKLFLIIQIQDPSVLPDASPRWTTTESIIGVNPGVGVRPSQPAADVHTSILSVDLNFDAPGAAENKLPDELNTMTGSEGYAYRLHDFLKVYRENIKENRGNACVDKKGHNADENIEFCRFDLATLGPCATWPYGYGKNNFAPCIFLKLNRIFELLPDPMGPSTKEEPVDDSVKNDEFYETLKTKKFPEEVFVNCKGEYPADRELLKTGLDILPAGDSDKPAGGIPLKYFPYKKFVKGKNENALIALQFTNLNSDNSKGRLIHIICKVYYKGVVHSKKFKSGLVKFEVYFKK